eukprot:NODE_1066_length_1576_cov_0.547055.p1 type:complete len:158 gc:universal NODE_1066_length_1576_cov_0.547055:979-1452(+)
MLSEESMSQHDILLMALFATSVVSLNPYTFMTPEWMKTLNFYTVKLTWYYITVLHIAVGFQFEIYLYYTLFYFVVYYLSDLVLQVTGFDISGHVYITLMGYASLLHINRKVANLFLLCWTVCVGWTLINFHAWEEKIFGACIPLLFYCQMYERYPHN